MTDAAGELFDLVGECGNDVELAEAEAYGLVSARRSERFVETARNQECHTART